jgi:hypothetical protein
MTPCTQEKALERIEKKLDKMSDSLHAIDIRTTRLEEHQTLQEKYVESKSKRNGQVYGAIYGLISGIILLVIKEYYGK